MSYTVEPNLANIVERICKILEANTTLFPGAPNNLVNKIYRFQPPVPENPDSGIGPPLIFVTTPDKAVVFREQMGRDSRDAKGFQRAELEIYVVVITFDNTLGRQEAEKKNYAIVSAIKTALYKNVRLLDPAAPVDASRLSSTLELFDVPFILNTEEKSMVARNVVVRPKVDTKFN